MTKQGVLKRRTVEQNELYRLDSLLVLDVVLDFGVSGNVAVKSGYSWIALLIPEINKIDYCLNVLYTLHP